MERPVAAEIPDEDPLREQLLDAAARVFAEKGYDGSASSARGLRTS